MLSMKRHITNNLNLQKGFTLVEMLVSVAIFAVVMTVALGSLLAMSESDRKAQTLKSVINNLNFSLDSMSRAIRTGTTYSCDIAQWAPGVSRDCASTPANSFAFRAADATGSTVGYCLSGGAIRRSATTGSLSTTCSSSAYSDITSTEVEITTLSFYVTGAAAVGGIQPKVTILLSGYVTVAGSQRSEFNLQTTVTQRLYDQ